MKYVRLADNLAQHAEELASTYANHELHTSSIASLACIGKTTGRVNVQFVAFCNVETRPIVTAHFQAGLFFRRRTVLRAPRQ